MQLLLRGDPEITVELRRYAQARRLSLRVSQLDGRVTLTLPVKTSQSEANRFIREKELWIRHQLGNRPPEVVPGIGSTVMFEGTEVDIVAGRARTARFEDGKIIVPGDASRAAIRVAAFMKVIARERLSRACDQYAGQLMQKVQRLTLRDTRSRWGSCTSDGNLMFSWRLVMAPVAVLDYVAAHEVAHLVEMNHSQVYWSVVSRIYPGYREPRQWLRQNGARLHAYRFVQLT
ncbi:MAG: M48 family metallopeptidase [Paracoccaceae bacterium]